ncbi:hypothetical protein FHS82_002906 [Pseudochelatococcus lubricantis]|uniref:Uncharacterized protein n=1 Tax=Pseudochelatococcus lubricantis TaxID=1538102 RepID=A0ABX0V1H4_9HYPH|nr:hypothetical protein [Pseudochelatococcus lubricantis]
MAKDVIAFPGAIVRRIDNSKIAPAGDTEAFRCSERRKTFNDKLTAIPHHVSLAFSRHRRSDRPVECDGQRAKGK